MVKSEFALAHEINAGLEFHDSEVWGVESHANSLTVVFSAAYVHRSSGRPGLDAGSGYAQSVEMEFSDATWVGSLPECVGRLSDGQVVSNGVAKSVIELPYSSCGPVSAELQFTNGSLLSVSASALVCRFTGEPRFIESFSC